MSRLLEWLRHTLPAQLRRTLIACIVLCFFARTTISDIAANDALGIQTPVACHDVTSFKDGSTVEVNGTTMLFVEEDPGHRRVFLTQGEFRASIHHNAMQPLEVFANHVLIEDLGTQFDVAVHGSTTIIAVTEGQLRVHNRLDSGSETDPITLTSSGAQHVPVVLNKGDLARLEEQGDIVLVTTKDVNKLGEAQNRASWRDEQFVSFGQRLDEVVWQFERYTNTRILIEDAEVSVRVIGGTYDLTDVEGFLRSLQNYNLEATRVDGFFSEAPVYLLRHAPQREGRKPRASSQSRGPR